MCIVKIVPGGQMEDKKRIFFTEMLEACVLTRVSLSLVRFCGVLGACLANFSDQHVPTMAPRWPRDGQKAHMLHPRTFRNTAKCKSIILEEEVFGPLISAPNNSLPGCWPQMP